MMKSQKKAKSREIYNYLQDKRNLQVKNRKTYQNCVILLDRGLRKNWG